jgi:hypothetical protein
MESLDSDTGNAETGPVILVEFSDRPGLRPVALTASDAVRRSSEALNETMTVIREMADRVHRTVESMAKRPSHVQVAFGVKFDAEAGAVIAKLGIEGSVTVTLAWDAPP